jgi:hypothetical protein
MYLRIYQPAQTICNAHVRLSNGAGKGLPFTAFTLLPNIQRWSIKELVIARGILMALRTGLCTALCNK